jgi:hypothetical protein
MIDQPRRSVTRFFIPLIDVLTLLFCVFLIMPLARPEDEKNNPQPAGEELLKQHWIDQAEIRKLQTRLADVEKEKGLALQDRLALRVLEIDEKTGKLFYRDRAPDRHEIGSEAAARSLINEDRKVLGLNKKELMYVVLYPRNRESDKPTGLQREQYETWFRDVSVRFDKPGDEP